MRLLLIACILVNFCVLTLIAGCAGPSVSGLPVGTGRAVARGEIVEIRLPMASDRSRRWRISEYDSLYLSLDSTPFVVQTRDGLETVVRFRAKTRGVTHVEFVEVIDAISEREGERPERKRVRVRVT